ncbi:MAG: hypothetical protein C4516_04720 [Oxalobacter sp.]|jgi:hypothetical protein|nr:MAG: hypothetical protein C4516_04720 [Oxalobacter sp.]
MKLWPIIAIATLFLAMIGLGIFFAVQRHRRIQKAKASPFFRHGDDDDEPRGEKKHCDAYSAGTFYW